MIRSLPLILLQNHLEYAGAGPSAQSLPGAAQRVLQAHAVVFQGQSGRVDIVHSLLACFVLCELC